MHSVSGRKQTTFETWGEMIVFDPGHAVNQKPADWASRGQIVALVGSDYRSYNSP